jgi:hypothetical protein
MDRSATIGDEYQACEHPGWEAGEVHGWLVALRRYLIRRIPGFADAYEAANWGPPAKEMPAAFCK